MGVYIPNMEKPKDCDLCPFADLFGICKDDCPLIEIPTPHGRLVDVDDIKAKCINEVFESMGTVAITDPYPDDEWADDICDVPTILEAEE